MKHWKKVALLVMMAVLTFVVVGCSGNGVSQQELDRARELAAQVNADLQDVKEVVTTYDKEEKEYTITATIYSYLNKQQIADTAALVRESFVAALDAKNKGISITVFAVYDNGEKVGKAFYDAQYDRTHQTYLGAD